MPKSSDKVSAIATVYPEIRLLYFLGPVVLQRVKVNFREDSSNFMNVVSRPDAVILVVMLLVDGRA